MSLAKEDRALLRLFAEKTQADEVKVRRVRTKLALRLREQDASRQLLLSLPRTTSQAVARVRGRLRSSSHPQTSSIRWPVFAGGLVTAAALGWLVAGLWPHETQAPSVSNVAIVEARSAETGSDVGVESDPRPALSTNPWIPLVEDLHVLGGLSPAQAQAWIEALTPVLGRCHFERVARSGAIDITVSLQSGSRPGVTIQGISSVQASETARLEACLRDGAPGLVADSAPTAGQGATAAVPQVIRFSLRRH